MKRLNSPVIYLLCVSSDVIPKDQINDEEGQSDQNEDENEDQDQNSQVAKDEDGMRIS